MNYKWFLTTMGKKRVTFLAFRSYSGIFVQSVILKVFVPSCTFSLSPPFLPVIILLCLGTTYEEQKQVQ